MTIQVKPGKYKQYPYMDTFKRYDVNNGILLRDDLHTLFDRHDIIISPDSLTVKLSDNIMDNPYNNCYFCYNNIALNINEYSKKYL